MQFSAEVLAERRKGVGGSEVSALFGLSPYANLTALSLYFEKRGEIDRTVEESEAMFWGQVLEDPIAQVWAERNNAKIRRQPMRWMKDPEQNPLFVSMDRQIYDHPRGPGLLECKNFNYYKGKAIEALDDVPPFVRIQHMHGLAVTGYTWGAIAILVGGNKLLSWTVERDEDACQQIVETCREFMERVKQGIPPSVDSKSDVVLGEAYKTGGIRTITTLDPSIERVAHELTHWKAQAKAAEENWELRKNCIKLLMGNAEELLIPGYGSCTWKKTKDKPQRVFNVERFEREQPELFEQYVEKTVRIGHRTFKDVPDAEE